MREEGKKGDTGTRGEVGRALLLREEGFPFPLVVLAAQGGCTLRVANFLSLPPVPPARDFPSSSRDISSVPRTETTSALMEDISPLIMINS